MKKPSRQRALKGLAFSAVLLFAMSGALPAAAANSGCIRTPALDDAHQVSEASLGYGVMARSWQWTPGSDASGAALSSYGAKVSVVTGNLRKISFGVLEQGIPRTQDLRALSGSSAKALASLNGDYFDDNGPWNAMVQNGQVLYSPPGQTGVLGLIRHKVVQSLGYRTTGTLTLGTRKFNISGVNQLAPGSTSLVVYKPNFARTLTPKGQVTLVIKSGKIYKVYTKGAAVTSRTGTVIQISGYLAPIIAKYKAKAVAKISLPTMPVYEDRMSADSVTTVGSISSISTTLNFDSVNFKNLSATGSTLFDSNFYEDSRPGRVTIRIGQDSSGKLVIKNLYKYGASIKADAGGYVLQVTGSTDAVTARKFKVGELVTLSRAFKADAKSAFVTAAGRGPRLVEGSKLVWLCALHNFEYRPRSAIGWNQDGQVWLISSSRGYDAVDFGYRQSGSTSSQMGQWLLSQGATDAVLLDGGGSTTMQINKPDAGWQRFDLPDGAWWRALANAFSIEKRD
jgi:hypothetical protein